MKVEGIWPFLLFHMEGTTQNPSGPYTCASGMACHHLRIKLSKAITSHGHEVPVRLGFSLVEVPQSAFHSISSFCLSRLFPPTIPMPFSSLLWALLP